MKQIFIAAKNVLSDRRYAAGFILIAAVVFSLLFWIQVKTVPGNDGRFQVALFGWRDWAILVMIAVLNSLFIIIEVYVFNLKRSFAQTNSIGPGVLAGGVGPVRGRGRLRVPYETADVSRVLFRSGRALAASFGIGTSSGILASIFSTASCSLCVSAIFGFLGANTVVFLVDNRSYVVFVTMALLLLSLFLSARRFSNVCQVCKIK